jgi:thiosulfate/3-mercaptopyruvate sulfurtransferase
MADSGPLVDGHWLLHHVREPGLRVIDFRWYLDGRSGRAAYDDGHIPGAVFVDLDREVTGWHASGAGRHPLPSRRDFEVAMRDAGVRRGSRVVVYDDQGGFSAGRLWWLLRYFGHPNVAVLDGGLAAWSGDLSTETARYPPGNFAAAAPHESSKLDFEELVQAAGDLVLLDARSGPRYRGEVEPIDPKAGHIPGARNAPWQDNLDDDQRFLGAGELRRRFESLGVKAGGDVVAYCGSGVSACHNLLALEIAGLSGGRLYPGSWSDWSSRPEAPVATGGEEVRSPRLLP